MKKALSFILAVVMIIPLCSCGKKDTEQPVDTKDDSVRIFIADDVYITAVESYSGRFFEDGSDATVENIVQVTVVNEGEKDIQLLDFSATDAQGRELKFNVTTLLSGESVHALELNKAKYTENLVIDKAESAPIAYFTQDITLLPDTLLFMCSDNVIEIENVSKSDFPGGVIHYKNYINSEYYGGITYSLSIPQISKGERATLSSRHFKDGESRLMFVTYAESE